MMHPSCTKYYNHDPHRIEDLETCDGILPPKGWCGTSAIDETLHNSGKRCDSDLCTRTAAHKWMGLVDSRFAMVIGTLCTFNLCDPHDEFYREHMTEHRARRVF